ncbi:MAG: sterol desaturase family protein [Symploca sp. SIO2E6]|nr:sterol desaturase family protein [Symploca sp. SIO2E6]
MEERFVRTLVLFIVLTVVCGFLEKFWPSIPNQSKWRRGVWLDTFYWFFTPMVIQILSIIAIALVLLPFYLLLERSLAWESILSGYGAFSQLPLWVQGLIAIVVGDFIGYWTHRWHHTRHLWDYHAIHHSSEAIDWLTAVRLHPVNDIISRVMQASPLMLLGLSPIAVELYTPLLSAYIAFVHANVPWSYGPFRYLIASPAFHRWHHTMDEEGWGKNFAGLFPIYDVIFGTFYLPSRQPKNFGLYGDKMTESFVGHLLYPFRHRKFAKKWLA